MTSFNCSFALFRKSSPSMESGSTMETLPSSSTDTRSFLPTTLYFSLPPPFTFKFAAADTLSPSTLNFLPSKSSARRVRSIATFFFFMVRFSKVSFT